LFFGKYTTHGVISLTTHVILARWQDNHHPFGNFRPYLNTKLLRINLFCSEKKSYVKCGINAVKEAADAISEMQRIERRMKFSENKEGPCRRRAM